eukprot:CAMPEP_0196590746 /NCGR_PEP_ID=MMETSP1081-20130531/67422_1 /TAXON_ID=36882 /ORGANISM="Pyramimonas amylifera, Strain CCMP720" /LENGTH=67 /DNA_ID=CAMNT_0041913931 /DNA_START=63 /DNA_END=263 /DNA_ORIENTATION=+
MPNIVGATTTEVSGKRALLEQATLNMESKVAKTARAQRMRARDARLRGRRSIPNEQESALEARSERR